MNCRSHIRETVVLGTTIGAGCPNCRRYHESVACEQDLSDVETAMGGYDG